MIRYKIMNCRQNWSQTCEEHLNNHINREYSASYAYHLLSSYFDRDNVGLNKLVNYFNKSSLEEREHADKFMKYQNMRGGIVKLGNINIENELVDFNRNNDILGSFKIALDLEKTINQHLLDLHKVAEESGDPQFSDYLEGEFLNEQVEAISEISKHISVLERFGEDQHAMWNYIEENF